MKKFAIPPVYLLTSIIAMAWINYIYPFVTIFKGNLRYMGLVVSLGGIIIILITARLFNKANTPIRPFKKPGTLITDGLYKFSRNPVYLGIGRHTHRVCNVSWRSIKLFGNTCFYLGHSDKFYCYRRAASFKYFWKGIRRLSWQGKKMDIEFFTL